MEYARLGTSGLAVSRICLGVMSYGDPAAWEWVLAEEQAEPIVRRAAEAGVTLVEEAPLSCRSAPGHTTSPTGRRSDDHHASADPAWTFIARSGARVGRPAGLRLFGWSLPAPPARSQSPRQTTRRSETTATRTT
ncbi:hypothetical protein ACWDLG_32790 [Nonomuraea sp. NPDC003727]